jgi:hypothetical protein
MAMSTRQILVSKEDPNYWYIETWFETDDQRILTFALSSTYSHVIMEEIPRYYVIDDFSEFWHQDKQEWNWG